MHEVFGPPIYLLQLVGRGRKVIDSQPISEFAISCLGCSLDKSV